MKTAQEIAESFVAKVMLPVDSPCNDEWKQALVKDIAELVAATLAQARREALEEAAKLCDEEKALYVDSMRKCDAAGNMVGAQGDANAALACRFIADHIRAMAGK